MNRILKTIGITVVAALALSVMASAAQAVEFTAENYPTEFHGENGAGSEEFNTEAGSVECASTFSGTAEEASTTVTTVPVYSECVAFGFVEAAVNTEECHYLFHLGASLGEDKYTATVTVQCPTGQSIKITAATCAAEVGAQGPLSHVIVEDTTNGFLDVTAEVTEINYTVTKDGLFCPFSGTGAKEGGEYLSNEPISIGEGLSID